MAVNPYQQYQRQSVMTMTPGEMLTKLYDEAIKQLTGGVLLVEEKDYAGANTAFQKAQRVIKYLRATLDPQYEISKQLDALYEYFLHVILQTNLHKDTADLTEIKGVTNMLSELRETFIQADRQARAAG